MVNSIGFDYDAFPMSTPLRRLILFICLTVIYTLGTRYNLDGYELEYVQSARSLFHGDGLVLAPGFYDLPGIPDTWGPLRQIPRQHYLQSVVSVPFYVLGVQLFGEQPTIPGRGGYWDLPWGPVLMVALVNPLCSALTVLLVIGILTKLTRNEALSVTTGLIYGLATMAWPYAGLGLEPFQTCILTLCVFCAIFYRHAPTLLHLGVSLLPLMLLPNCKKYSIIFVAPLAVYYAASIWSNKRHRIPGLIMLTIVAAVALTMHVASTTHKLEHNPGYVDEIIQKLTEPAHSVFDIVTGLLVSPGEGIFVFNPILIYAVAGWPGFFRKHRLEAGMFLGFLLVWLAAASRISYLLIDEEWGPRYLHVLIPFMVMAGAESLTMPRKSFRKWLFVGILAISILLQVFGTLFLGFRILDVSIAMGIKDLSVPLFTPSASQPVIAGTLFLSMIHRYFTTESLTVTHIQYLNYAGLGADRIYLQQYLNGFDNPVGALFTGRWVLTEMGVDVWSEQQTFVVWLLILTAMIGLILLITRPLRTADLQAPAKDPSDTAIDSDSSSSYHDRNDSVEPAGS